MKVNYGKMMKQVQKMQEDMAKTEESLSDERVEAGSGGGAIRVVANGRQEILEIHIDPDAVTPDDVDMLQDLVLTAVNNALHEARELAAKKMQQVAGGLGLPGMM